MKWMRRRQRRFEHKIRRQMWRDHRIRVKVIDRFRWRVLSSGGRLVDVVSTKEGNSIVEARLTSDYGAVTERSWIYAEKPLTEVFQAAHLWVRRGYAEPIGYSSRKE